MTENRPLVCFLKRICRENLTGSKNLIMPSYLDGNTLKKSLSREGFFALNLNITTIFDLARDYCDDYISKNFTYFLQKKEQGTVLRSFLLFKYWEQRTVPCSFFEFQLSNCEMRFHILYHLYILR